MTGFSTRYGGWWGCCGRWCAGGSAWPRFEAESNHERTKERKHEMRHTPSNGRHLRIAHVVLQLDVGGMEKLLVEFARHVDREKFAQHFICLGCRGAVAAEIESQGWPVTMLNEPDGLRPGLVFRLARLFGKLRPDVIHAHNA